MADEQPILVPDLLQVLAIINQDRRRKARSSCSHRDGSSACAAFRLNFHALILVSAVSESRTGTRAGRMDPQTQLAPIRCPPATSYVCFCFKAGSGLLELSAKGTCPAPSRTAVSSGLLPWLVRSTTVAGAAPDLTGFPILRLPFEAAP